jgi:hypothetical protein
MWMNGIMHVAQYVGRSNHIVNGSYYYKCNLSGKMIISNIQGL